MMNVILSMEMIIRPMQIADGAVATTEVDS